MTTAQFDVIVVGGGAAGLTAAIALARAGFATVVVEAAAFPGLLEEEKEKELEEVKEKEVD